MQLRFESESSAEVRFEVLYAQPPSCGHFPRVALFLSRRLRWRSVVHHNSRPRAGPNANANSRSGTESNANSRPGAQPHSNAYTNAGAVRSIGETIMVGEYLKWCDKLQRLPVISIYWALHKNWQCRGYKLYGHLRDSGPNLFLHRDFSQ
jgi:hypothetical protein